MFDENTDAPGARNLDLQRSSITPLVRRKFAVYGNLVAGTNCDLLMSGTSDAKIAGIANEMSANASASRRSIGVVRIGRFSPAERNLLARRVIQIPNRLGQWATD